METDVHFSPKLMSFWKPFTQTKEIITKEKVDTTPAIARKAFNHLTKIDAYCSSTSTIPKEAYSIALELTNTIMQVINCIRDSNLAGIEETHVLNAKQNSISIALSQKFPEDLKIYSFIALLTKMPPETSAFDALIGKNGIFTSHLLQACLEIHSEEILWRCIVNSGLRKVQDIIVLFYEQKHENGNPFTILKTHLDQSRENARSQMTQEEREKFDAQWNSPYKPLTFIDRSIMANTFSPDPEKIEAHDFIRESREKNMYTVFKGDKGDYFYQAYHVKIKKGSYATVHQSGYPASFWSPDGIQLYALNCVGQNSHLNGNIFNAKYSFEFQRGFDKQTICFAMNQSYGIAYLETTPHQAIPLARYERQNNTDSKAFIEQADKWACPFETCFTPRLLIETDGKQFCIYEDFKHDRVQVFTNQEGKLEQLDCSITKQFEGNVYTLPGGTLVVSSHSVKYKKIVIESISAREYKVELPAALLPITTAEDYGFKSHPAQPQKTVLDLYK